MAMNPRLLRPLATGFDPRRIAGLVGWYDSSDLSTMAQNSDGTGAVAAGDQVGYWKDKSPSAAHVTQGIAANRPTLTASAFNGRTALVFDGSNDGLSASSYSAQTGHSGLTRFWVCSQISTSGNGVVSNITGQVLDLFQRFSTARVGWGSITSNLVSAVKTGPFSPFVFASVYQSGASPSMKFYFDSIEQATTVSGTLPSSLVTGSGDLWIGSESGAAWFWHGPICEGVFYSRALSVAEVGRVSGYLQKKWGVT